MTSTLLILLTGTAHLSGSPAAVLQWQALCSCSVLKLPVEELLKLAIVHLEAQSHQRRHDLLTVIHIGYEEWDLCKAEFIAIHCHFW